MRNKNYKLNRRNFLLGAGGVAVALPFLRSLAPRKAHAAPPGPAPKRYIQFFHHQGTIPHLWKPTGGETDFGLHGLLAGLEPHRDKLLLISGIDNRARYLNVESDGHASAEKTIFTCMPYAESMDGQGNLLPGTQQPGFGQAGGPSVDQVIASRIGAGTSFTSIDLAIGAYGDSPIETQTAESGILFSAASQPIASIVDPVLTYQYLFSDSGAGGDAQALEELLARRMSVLDAVKDNFDHIRGRASSEDRVLLDAHADHIRQIEIRLQNALSCEPPTLNLPPGFNHILDHHLAGPIQIDLMVLAMACGLSNVGTFVFPEGHGPTFPWIEDPSPVVPPLPAGYEGEPDVDPPEFGYSNWHDMVHRGLNATEWEIEQGGQTEPGLVAGMQFYADQFAYLLQRLAETPDAEGGTLLDSSTVLWTSEFGNGGQHWISSLPTVIAGTMGPDVELGRHLDWETSEEGDWELNQHCSNQLYTSLLQVFGGDDESFGFIGDFSIDNSWGETFHVNPLGGALPL